MDKPQPYNSLVPLALAVSSAGGAVSTASALMGSSGTEALRLAISAGAAVLVGILGTVRDERWNGKAGGATECSR